MKGYRHDKANGATIEVGEHDVVRLAAKDGTTLRRTTLEHAYNERTRLQSELADCVEFIVDATSAKHRGAA